VHFLLLVYFMILSEFRLYIYAPPPKKKNWKWYGKKHLWYNQETILAFSWRDLESHEKPQMVSWLSLELSSSWMWVQNLNATPVHLHSHGKGSDLYSEGAWFDFDFYPDWKMIPGYNTTQFCGWFVIFQRNPLPPSSVHVLNREPVGCHAGPENWD
jgi:hypothetical protein